MKPDWDWEKKLVKHDLENAVKKSVKFYGIEGCEDKAKDLLKLMPTCRDKFLETLYGLYKFGGRIK